MKIKSPVSKLTKGLKVINVEPNLYLCRSSALQVVEKFFVSFKVSNSKVQQLQPTPFWFLGLLDKIEKISIKETVENIDLFSLNIVD